MHNSARPTTRLPSIKGEESKLSPVSIAPS